MSCGKAIQQLRKKIGFTQTELGENLNVTSQAVSKWENDLSQPDFETIRKMTGLFGITIDEFAELCKETDSEVAATQVKKRRKGRKKGDGRRLHGLRESYLRKRYRRGRPARLQKMS